MFLLSYSENCQAVRLLCYNTSGSYAWYSSVALRHVGGEGRRYGAMRCELLKGYWFVYRPRRFVCNNSTFCPHSVFMCFVWIWEQTAIISLYRIDWLVFITETECVYCVVVLHSTFCPHSVFMCFVWIWDHKAIISPHRTTHHQLVRVGLRAETQVCVCVKCPWLTMYVTGDLSRPS